MAGSIGRALEVVFAPIGFNWQISLALVPGLAAREVAVGALGTVYSLSSDGDVSATLAPMIAHTWSLATALSLLAWYVFAPQCLSTLVVVKRETNSWRYPLAMAARKSCWVNPVSGRGTSRCLALSNMSPISLCFHRTEKFVRKSLRKT
jgi:ferrous iron transport protein B